VKKFDYITPPNNILQVPARFISTVIVRKIAWTSVTPNQLTIFRGLIYVLILLLFSIGTYKNLIIAFLLFQIMEIFDHVDGDLARYKGLCTKTGALLEHMADTFGSKTSNLFGLCISIGVYRHTGSFDIFYAFIAVALGRSIWLEFRETFFQWQEKQAKVDEHGGTDMPSYLTATMLSEKAVFKKKLARIFFTVFSWQNQLILWSALLCYPIEKHLHINPIFWAMVIIALLTHLIWIVGCVSGFSQALRFDNKG